MAEKPGASPVQPAIVRHVGSVSLATLISRILGYVRDALVASAFGGGHLTDAFYAAFRIPNLFRRILGEGPLTSAFVPVFTEKLSRDREESRKFFQSLFSLLLVVLGGLVLLGILGAPLVTRLVAWGFRSDPAKFALTVSLTRLLFPFLLFICAAAVASGALNSLGHFFLPAAAPAMLSVSEYLFVLALARVWKDPMKGLALSAVLGGALHFFVLAPLLRRESLLPGWRWNPGHPDIRRVFLALVPAVWGLSVDQINAFVDTVCASFLREGSVTALYNSNRLMQFPLALFGVAMSTAALPSLSAHAAREDWAALKSTLNLSVRLVIFMVFPAMAGLLILSTPIVQVLFEHGKFTHGETLLTQGALAAYCLGLPGFAGVKVLVSSFYALKDTRTPARLATVCMAINILGNVLLMGPWGVSGLAFATAAASTANGGLLFWFLRKKIGLLGGKRMVKTLFESFLASLGMAFTAGLLGLGLSGSLFWRVPLAVIAGTAVYGLLAKFLEMEEYGHVRDIFLGILWKKPSL